ncbi:MAG: hypothetical protein GEU88_11045 [Solirubrobacterales bacterium]|nr:hypothetical protein [Solirubrobacterales bacterium]
MRGTIGAIGVVLAFAVATLVGGCELGGGDEDEGTTTSASARGGAPVASASCEGDSRQGAAIVVPDVVTQTWRLASSNVAVVRGCVLWDGQPVEGVRVRVGQYRVRAPTDGSGGFQYTLDSTLGQARTVSVADASDATLGGEPLDEEATQALLDASASLGSHFRLSEIEARRRGDGSVLLTGQASYANGTPPQPVVLFAYQLSGRVTDRNGEPVEGARVSTRTPEEGLESGWSLSLPTDAKGRYTDFFYPAAPPGQRSQLVVRVGKGRHIWEFPEGQFIEFPRLRSSVMDVQLPPPDFALAPPTVRARDGVVYEGLLVGVIADGRPVDPLRARWPDARGRFAFVLPSSLAGRRVSFWQSVTYLFARRTARPGAPIDLRYWPKRIPPGSPRGVARMRLPG